MAQKNAEYIWWDKKRYFGLKLSFTTYAISEDRLFQETGLLSRSYEEVLLYRVRDITLTRSLWQMLFRVGTITVHSSDKSASTLEMVNVKAPKHVKELLHQQVEDMKIRRRVRFGEIAAFGDDMDDQLDGEF